MRNLLATCPEKGHRPKVLLLGISYPSVPGQIEKHGFDPEILTIKEPSVDQAVECVRRGILTEMDARDLARCVATEQAGDVDVYTVSKEIGAVYRDDRHVHANFNARQFCGTLKEAFGDDVQFSQVILDYYWMPTGWLVTRWARTLFQKTLPELVRLNMLTYPSRRTRRRRKNDSSREVEEGVVYLPFCAHVCKELVGAIDTLENYYSISFVKKADLAGHSLWKGTMEIDGDTMQNRLGKRLDQEEIYCTFRPKDINESMEDSHVSKPAVMRILKAIEDYDNIRMIRLRPLRQHEPPSVMKERLVKPEIGGFQGLNFNLNNKKKKSPEKPQKPVKKVEDEENQAEEEVREHKPVIKKRRRKQKTEPETDFQEESPPKKRKGPVFDDVEEPTEEERERYKIPDFTLFYPAPAVNLKTYDEPKQSGKADNVPSLGRRRRLTEKSKAAGTKVLDLESASSKRKRLPKPWKQPKQYLSYNPRVSKTTAKKGNTSLVLDLCMPADPPVEHSKNSELDVARSLFGIRNTRLKGLSRNIMEKEELTCYVIPKGAIEDRIGKNNLPPMFRTDELLEEYETLESKPIFQAVVDACREGTAEALCAPLDWESHLSLTELVELRKTNTRFATQAKKARERNDFAAASLHRGRNLDEIVRWILSGRDERLDPTGCFQLIDDTRASLRSDEMLVTAKRIEAALYPKLKRLADGQSDKPTLLTSVVQRYYNLNDHTGATILDKVKNDRETRLRQNILKWLEHRQESNDPTGAFREIEALLTEFSNTDIPSRADEIANRIQFLCCLGLDGWMEKAAESSKPPIKPPAKPPIKQPKAKKRRRTLKEKDAANVLSALFNNLHGPVTNLGIDTMPSSMGGALPASGTKGLDGSNRTQRKKRKIVNKPKKAPIGKDAKTTTASHRPNKAPKAANSIKSELETSGLGKTGRKKAKKVPVDKHAEAIITSQRPSKAPETANSIKSEVAGSGKGKASRKKAKKAPVDKHTETMATSQRPSEAPETAASIKAEVASSGNGKAGRKKAKSPSSACTKLARNNRAERQTSDSKPCAASSPKAREDAASAVHGVFSPGNSAQSQALADLQKVVRSVKLEELLQKTANRIAHELPRLSLSVEVYKKWVAQYAAEKGVTRAQTLNSICQWLALEDMQCEHSAEYQYLQRLVPIMSQGSILQRASDLEQVLNSVRQSHGPNWRPVDIEDSQSLLRQVRNATRTDDPRLTEKVIQAIGNIHFNQNQHAVCVTPSPPNSLFEGWCRDGAVRHYNRRPQSRANHPQHQVMRATATPLHAVPAAMASRTPVHGGYELRNLNMSTLQTQGNIYSPQIRFYPS